MRELQTYLFCDLETTGLDPKSCSIIEIACILTRGPDTGFQEIGRYETFVEPGPTWERKALEMHQQSGLLNDMEGTRSLPIIAAAMEARRIVAGYSRPIFAARNPHFDRGFIAEHMLVLDVALHYRQFDITTICLIDPSLYDYDHGVEGTPHRAMYDCERDLEYAREFVKRCHACAYHARKGANDE